MNIIYRILHYLIARDSVNIDPLAHMSLRERADMPPWHEEPLTHKPATCKCFRGTPNQDANDQRATH